MFSKNSIFVHFGSKAFDMEKFEHVRNCDNFSKPIIGGLWASPENSENGWQRINSLRPQDKFFF